MKTASATCNDSVTVTMSVAEALHLLSIVARFERGQRQPRPIPTTKKPWFGISHPDLGPEDVTSFFGVLAGSIVEQCNQKKYREPVSYYCDPKKVTAMAKTVPYSPEFMAAIRQMDTIEK